MKTSDWDNLELRALGRKWAAEAYDLASELHDRGADAAQLLRSRPDLTRPREISIPAMMADVLMAILLTLPRQVGLRTSRSERMSPRSGRAYRKRVEHGSANRPRRARSPTQAARRPSPASDRAPGRRDLSAGRPSAASTAPAAGKKSITGAHVPRTESLASNSFCASILSPRSSKWRVVRSASFSCAASYLTSAIRPSPSLFSTCPTGPITVFDISSR